MLVYETKVFKIDDRVYSNKYTFVQSIVYAKYQCIQAGSHFKSILQRIP